MLLVILIIQLFNPIISQRNVNYNQTATSFVQQFYAQFDLPYLRLSLKVYYDINDSTYSLNGDMTYGTNSIFDKLNFIPKINNRTIMTIDNQPKIDGGTISQIHGKFQYDNGTVVWFTEMIVIGLKGTTFYIQNQILRITTGNPMQGSSGSGNSFVFSNVASTSSGNIVGTTPSTGLKFSG
ncbi:hypothetical protein ACKWTF_004002 [Chironomus riparius]